jgi:hypothetical protein
MKKSIPLLTLLISFILISKSNAQIGIGTSTPDKSAVLDVTGTNRGFLAPRMNTAQRNAISSPAKGLMVFDNDSSYFFYYDGSAWKSLKTIAVLSPWHRTGTKVLLNSSTDSVGIGKTPKYGFDIRNSANVDSFYMISGQRILNIKGGQNLFIGQSSGKNNSGSVNQFSGYQAGMNNTSGDSNYFSGYEAGMNNKTMNFNHFEGYKSGFSNVSGTQNVFIGPEAGYFNSGGSDDYFSGVQAGYSNTTGSINQFVGFHAGFSNTTGATNMFTGFNAGFSNTSGNGNYFSGAGSGYNNTTGNTNFFEGLQSGFSNTTGSNNYISGHQAGTANTTGNNNQFIGYQAGNRNNTGSSNCFIGYQSGYKNTTGVHNYYSGYFSGYSGTSGGYNCAAGDSAGAANTGNNNTFLGFHADANVSGLSNAAAIGNGALVSISNTMAFGNTGTNGWAFGLSSVSAGHALEVGTTSSNGNGAYLTAGGTWTNASDRNKKENFTALDSKEILNRITTLQITRWNYIGEQKNTTHIGPVAQDFYRLFRTGSDSITISTIDPSGVALIGIQELKKQNDLLKSELDALKKENAALKSSSAAQNAKLEDLSAEIAKIKGLLLNNAALSNSTMKTTTQK